MRAVTVSYSGCNKYRCCSVLLDCSRCCLCGVCLAKSVSLHSKLVSSCPRCNVRVKVLDCDNDEINLYIPPRLQQLSKGVLQQVPQDDMFSMYVFVLTYNICSVKAHVRLVRACGGRCAACCSLDGMTKCHQGRKECEHMHFVGSENR